MPSLVWGDKGVMEFFIGAVLIFTVFEIALYSTLNKIDDKLNLNNELLTHIIEQFEDEDEIF